MEEENINLFLKLHAIRLFQHLDARTQMRNSETNWPKIISK